MRKSFITGVAALALALLLSAPAARAQFADQAQWGGAAGGTANAQTVTIANAGALADLLGAPIRFLPFATNTGAATLAVSGLTPTAILKPGGSGLTALVGGELQLTQFSQVVYDGTEFVLTNPTPNGAAFLPNYIGGLVTSNDVGTPLTVVDTAAGAAASDDNTVVMKLPAFTKNGNAGWVVGSGNGCLDSGSTLSVSTWYHLYVIQRLDTSVVDELCSTNATSPTMPGAGAYTKKRRIGSFKTDGAAHIIAYIQYNDEFWWKTPPLDMNGVSTSAMNYPISTPLGVRVRAIFNLNVFSTSATPNTVSVYVASPDLTSQVSATTASPLATFMLNVTAASGLGGGAQGTAWTDTSSNVLLHFVANGGSVEVFLATQGWKDPRGQ